jgi:multicomponent Na+:H+ antiporter subunit D
MNEGGLVLLAILLTSLIPGLVIFFLAETSVRLRTAINLAGALLKLLLLLWVMYRVGQGDIYELRWPFLPGIDLVLRADYLAVFFGTLSAVLWLLTTLYAVGYLEGSPHRSRFFGFFSLCVFSTTGIALAGNLPTFFVFYELLTLTTYPLVVHRGTAEAFRAGRVYLVYTLGGGVVLLLGVVWLTVLAGPADFAHPAGLEAVYAQQPITLALMFALLVAGLGVKAALFPLHGWLPVAMVAPAPVSALLHAVAVVKAGAFGVVRVVYDVFGVDLLDRLELGLPLALWAAVTILYGSLMALRQDDLKRRLAYSTVSQVSYIVLGVALLGPLATAGGLVHLVHQGLMKITLFLCAGNFSEVLSVKKVSQMAGIGQRMPWSMAAFSLAALGMVGLPPLVGFYSKWYLGLGALESSYPAFVLVLLASSLLNAAYFLPILYTAWFVAPRADVPRPSQSGGETSWMLLLPPLATSLLVLGMGLLADAPFSPLVWARRFAQGEYGP